MPDAATIDIPRPVDSPVFKDVDTKRKDTAKEEDKNFKSRAEGKKEVYTAANRLLDEKTSEMKASLQKQYETLMAERAKLGENSSETDTARVNQLTQEYQRQRDFVESMALASTSPDGSRRGTQQKIAALAAVRADLIGQLMDIRENGSGKGVRVTADVLSYPGIPLRLSETMDEDLTNTLATEILRVNGAISNLDELVRSERGMIDRIGKAVADDLTSLFKGDRFVLAEQKDYAMSTRDVLMAAEEDMQIARTQRRLAGVPVESIRAHEEDLVARLDATNNKPASDTETQARRVARLNQDLAVTRADILVADGTRRPDRLRSIITEQMSQERKAIYDAVDKKKLEEEEERQIDEAAKKTTADKSVKTELTPEDKAKIESEAEQKKVDEAKKKITDGTDNEAKKMLGGLSPDDEQKLKAKGLLVGFLALLASNALALANEVLTEAKK